MEGYPVKNFFEVAKCPNKNTPIVLVGHIIGAIKNSLLPIAYTCGCVKVSMEVERMSNVTVALEEEYGYRYWVWETEMDEATLIQWLKDQKEDETFVFLDLPGRRKLITVGEYKFRAKKGWHGMFHQLDDSYLIAPDGTKYDTIYEGPEGSLF